MIVLVVLALAAHPVAPLDPLRVVHPYVAVGRYGAGDRGVDLAGVLGQAVRSSTAGTVLFAGAVAGQPVVSVSLGDGRRLTYEPVTPTVRAGQVLAAGTVLGRLSGTHPGCPAPACLHWGLREADGSYADPLLLLGPPRVRLLPLAGIPLGVPGAAASHRVPATSPPGGTRGTGKGPGSSAPGPGGRSRAAVLGAGAAGVTAAGGILANHRRRRAAAGRST